MEKKTHVRKSFGGDWNMLRKEEELCLRKRTDAPPHSLKDSNASPKMKTTEKKVRVRSLTRSILGVEGCARALGWGLGKVTSGSIIHTDLYKPNTKLVSAYLEHFWCINKSQAYMNSQDSPRLKLGGSHHLLPYSILCVWP